VKIAAFWSVTPSSLAELYRLERGLYCQRPWLWKHEIPLKPWNTCTRRFEHNYHGENFKILVLQQ